LPLRVTELTALVRADDALLDREAERLLLPAPEPLFSDPCVLRRVRLAPLREAPEPLQRRALRCLLREALPQDAALVHIRALQALLENPAPAARADLPGRLTVRRSYDALELVRGTPPVFRPVPLAQTVHFPALGLRAVCTLAEKNEKIQNTPFTFALKYDKMVGRIPVFRPRKTGDMLTLPDGRCVTLKKLFLDRRLPQPVRDRVPVLELDGQVIAVAGFGADPRWTARDGEQAVILRIEKEEM
ncbi:MAG: tRNA lysidine(34) synthetase TilS, partial [Oscillospiraceae bacterium]|nr:tRNA lysidine(34) synthetase TilS [Oscillospiraceae bacterium]